MYLPESSKNKPFDVIGIGNAIVDVVIQVNESFLTSHGLEKGSMELVTEAQAKVLYQESGKGLESSGGSAANTIASLAQLGSKSGFIGRVRKDTLGNTFTNDIRSTGAQFTTSAVDNGPSTAHCLILVTPDAQRTMCTYLGASTKLNPKDIDLSIVSNTKVLYLEGYLWDSPEAKEAFIEASKTCREAGGQVALSLSDSFCVDRHRESFIDLLNGYVDILFANEAEATSLYETSDFEEAINNIKGLCKVTALTCSEKGSVVLAGGQRWEIPAYKLGNLIDTTGAGDLYAGGFLHGYTNGASMVTCGSMGSLCAGQIITQLGSRSNTSLKEILSIHLD